MSLIRPIESWPLILCGPMLRRVTANRVAVFIALREPARVRLRLYSSDGIELVGATSDEHPTRALGERLHAVVAQSTYVLAQLPGGNGRYDLEITWLRNDVAHTATLRTLGKAELASENPDLLSGEHALGYAEGVLPGFRIADSLESLALVHASCRKPHGEGPDMLALVDQLMIEGANGSTRPHQLILTGDQIYADDVALPLARLIAATAPELMTSSAARRVPGNADDDYHGEIPDDLQPLGDDPQGRAMNHADLAPGIYRKHQCARVAGLTSGECEGHLMYLGEFYAMYLLAWSPSLWPDEFDFDVDPPAAPTTEAVKKQLAHFIGELPKVRRALANVPSFMMFDDHEVTDDWNLSRYTADRVLARWSGRQVVRNALCAYAVFQDWGNRPDHYEAAGNSPGATLLTALTCPVPEVASVPQPLARRESLPPLLSSNGQAARNAVDALFGLRIPPQQQPPPPTMDWHYRVDFPSHRLIALDTRTRRQLPADGGPAGIIDPAHLTAQLGLPDTAGSNLQNIVIVAGPVFDLPPTELLKDGVSRAVRVGVGNFKHTAAAKLDRETWSGNHAAMAAMVRCLMKFETVVLLSGDLHYAFTHDVEVADEGSDRARIVQLCSSGARNETSGSRLAALATASGPGQTEVLPDPPSPVSILLDQARHFEQVVGDRLQEVADIHRAMGPAALQTASELMKSRLRLSLGQAANAVTTLPLAAFKHAAGFELLADLELPVNTLRCRVHHLMAQVHDGQDRMRPCTGDWVKPPPGALYPGSTDPDLVLIESRDLRQAMGSNNIGLLRFLPEEISHTLFWYSITYKGRWVRLWCTEHRALRRVPNVDEV